MSAVLKVEIKGNDVADAFKRKQIIDKILATANTEDLEKLGQMCTPKGIDTLRKKWSLIKKFC